MRQRVVLGLVEREMLAVLKGKLIEVAYMAGLSNPTRCAEG